MEYRILASLFIALTAGKKFICFVVRLETNIEPSALEKD